jgi:hypothetical protein
MQSVASTKLGRVFCVHDNFNFLLSLNLVIIAICLTIAHFYHGLV